MFWFVDSDLKLDKPQATLKIDRDLVADLGLTQQDVGNSLGAALGGGYVNYFSLAGRSYKVIPQVLQKDRQNPSQVLDYYIKAGDGSLIPASTVAHIETSTVPEAINHFQQLNSATIAGAPGVSQAEALQMLRDAVNDAAPTGYNVDYSGQSRQFVHGSSGVRVHDVVCPGDRVPGARGAVREFPRSDRDPGVGAHGVVRSAVVYQPRGRDAQHLYAGRIGHIAGLISKHGILIVQFANELQREGAQQARVY